MSENPRGFNGQGSISLGDWRKSILAGLDAERPVLIAGPTASGKSSLAAEIADRRGGQIVNADALQVFSDWRILTARPSTEEESTLPHVLYGHVPGERAYSVGDWLRDVAPLLSSPRPIIVGGTGLYFRALTEGLADIPETPPEIRREADRRMATDGAYSLLSALDPDTLARIDRQNPVRVQRAWEVLRATGRGLAAWQDDTGPPLLPLGQAQTVLLEAGRDWLNARIEARFAQMLKAGLLDEARRNRARWDPRAPSAKAIGAAELMAHLDGALPAEGLAEQVATLTRQYAKRQRTWFRKRMNCWNWYPCH